MYQRSDRKNERRIFTMNIPNKNELTRIYGEAEKSAARFQAVADHFAEIYHHDIAEFFTAPGRTEIIGNHTDHNGGRVIAGSIDMDTIGAAYPNNSSVIRITSEGYDKEVVVDINDLASVPKAQGTVSLVAGMVEAIQKFGFKVAGFDAYVTTNVIRAAGVSSSASFEMLVCSIINYFFNDGAMTYINYAKAGQYAENVYWLKASGLMDQLACAVGGPILLDFSDRENPKYEKVNFSFHDYDHHLVIVNTGKGHADLSEEYSEIPMEMKEAAKAAGAELLCETTLDKVLANMDKIDNDRAILRAIHFFKENERVERAAKAVEEKDGETVLKLLSESGESSWELLQNCYPIKAYTEQKISVALALTDLFLEKLGKGICRIHGRFQSADLVCVCDLLGLSDIIGHSAVCPVVFVPVLKIILHHGFDFPACGGIGGLQIVHIGIRHQRHVHTAALPVHALDIAVYRQLIAAEKDVVQHRRQDHRRCHGCRHDAACQTGGLFLLLPPQHFRVLGGDAVRLFQVSRRREKGHGERIGVRGCLFLDSRLFGLLFLRFFGAWQDLAAFRADHRTLRCVISTVFTFHVLCLLLCCDGRKCGKVLTFRPGLCRSRQLRNSTSHHRHTTDRLSWLMLHKCRCCRHR